MGQKMTDLHPYFSFFLFRIFALQLTKVFIWASFGHLLLTSKKPKPLHNLNKSYSKVLSKKKPQC
ncbi:Hypothetical protein I595_1409 [Croceitalea dokdonensis DOKDO 023]|uniref:Uncharacterized protein n=1 Tax=Croceitalea dokdonensis DOKDO 023 TaxID=1300341 RepID=A0A0P7B3C9_9FLAO|nr:Hypothetical protein I595_1409 [Croceitalea dokdonensis DOKDO 023]